MAHADERPRRGRRPGRRLLVALAVGTVAVLAAGSLLVVTTTAGPDELRRLLGGSTPDASEETSGQTTDPGGRPGPTDPDPAQDPGAVSQALLPATQLPDVAARTPWEVTRTGSGIASVCQPSPSARPHPEAVFVRRYRADTGRRQLAVQSVEVTRSPAGAAAAYQTMTGWYAGCQVPRLQLMSSAVVDGRGRGSDVRILTLRSWRNPVRTLTVAVARTGVIATALVHEVDRFTGPGARAMARTMSRAVDRLCRTSGGLCGSGRSPVEAPLPPTGEAPGFLGVVDLPPVRGQRAAWAGTGTIRATGINPASTLCDRVDFGRRAFTQVRARSFVMPQTDLPQRFGLSETIGRATRKKLAPAFVEQAAARVAGCPDRELSARVRSHERVRSGDVEGHTWRLTFQLAEDVEVDYRLALVRRGNRVAEVSFSGTPEADIGGRAFAGLALRAGERLRELDPPAR